MRRLWLAVAFAVAACHVGDAHAIAFAPVNHPGPALSVPSAQLAASLQCSPGIDHARRTPILLVPGTGITAEQEFSWNYEPALTRLGIPWCGVTFPDSGNDDMQINGEYIVSAIRTMHARAGRRIAIYGHSQGGEVPRWALRFWPDTRSMVDDVVGAAGPNHGTVVADTACNGTRPCQPSDWQARTSSHFTAALNSDQETFPGISYTEIYSHDDEEVQPNQNNNGTSSLHGGGGQISDVAVQDICPTDTSEHLALGSYDPVTWALLVDALDHGGPADPARIGLAPCTETFMPGVNPGTFAQNAAAAAIDVETSPAQSLNAEGPLACYTTATCPQARPQPARCTGQRSLSRALRAGRGDRLIRVAVYRGRQLIARARGHRITAIRVRIADTPVALRVHTLSDRGHRQAFTWRIRGACPET